MNRMNCAILYEKHKNSSAKRIETVVFRRFFPILRRHIRIFLIASLPWESIFYFLTEKSGGSCRPRAVFIGFRFALLDFQRF